jgi:hypothetical protein
MPQDSGYYPDEEPHADEFGPDIDPLTGLPFDGPKGQNGRYVDNPEFGPDEEATPDELATAQKGIEAAREIVAGGIYVEAKTETINAHLPEEPKAPAPLTQAEEDALTDLEWLETLPLLHKLRDERIPVNIFSRAALDFRKLRKSITATGHEIKRTIDGSASDDFSQRMRAFAATSHPKEWKFSRERTGGFQLW